MSDIDFNTETALEAAEALERVLAQRTHRKTIMGQECTVPGQLGYALKLPDIIRNLRSRARPARERGLERFEEVWASLSDQSRKKVRDALGWYDPRELDWEDRRSNRRPVGPD